MSGSAAASAGESGRSSLRTHGRTFHLAHLLLGERAAADVHLLYGFCRFVDDECDERPIDEARVALARIRTDLEAGSSDEPSLAGYLAFCDTHTVDPRVTEAFLQGVEQDLDLHEYTTEAELLRYCYRVAGTVGLLMCSLFDVDEPRARAFAVDLGIGMQLTNICRDVLEDAERGRVYVPHESSGGPLDAADLVARDAETVARARRAVERLLDRDGDGFFETHEVVGEGWQGWNYHQFTFGLVHRDGKLYTALSTTMAPPAWEGMETNSGPNDPLRGCVLEIDTQSGEVVAFAGGVRTPNGLGLDAEGRLLYSDNQGAWMPTSILAAVEEGDFFGHYNWTRFVPKLAERFPDGGHPSVFCDRPRKAPTVWLPHGEVVNSPTEPLLIQGGDFDGQLLLGELTGGGIRRVHLYESNGGLLGTRLRFTQGLESGVNRMEWGPDGALYVGGIGANGNWNWRGTRPSGGRCVESWRICAPTPRCSTPRCTRATWKPGSMRLMTGS